MGIRNRSRFLAFDALSAANRFPPRWKRSKKGNAEGGGATLQEIESRLRLGPELDKFGHKVVEALARAVLRFVEGNSGETTIN